MITTNTSTSSNSHTYVQLRCESEKLLKLAQELEELARNSPNFFEQDEFLRKKAEYRDQYISIQSLCSA
jgi:hypothetical protein